MQIDLEELLQKRYSVLQKPHPVVLQKYSNSQISPAKSTGYYMVRMKDIKHIKECISVGLPIIKPVMAISRMFEKIYYCTRPIYKKNLENNRPIEIISSLDKIIEGYVFKYK